MTRVLLDSTTPFQSIPPGWTGLVGTYCTGLYAVPLADVEHAFPRATGHVRINVDGNPSFGNCLDVETGDATPGDVDRWLRDRLSMGVPPDTLGVYCNRSTLPAVLAATTVHAFHWVATLDGTAHIAGYAPLCGPAAVQILGAAQTGTNADLSIVFADNWILSL